MRVSRRGLGALGGLACEAEGGVELGKDPFEFSELTMDLECGR